MPIPLELIDGSIPASGPITHCFPTPVRIHGDTSQPIVFQVTQLGHYQVVLGFPWLYATNPKIDWSSGQLDISHASVPCLTATCLTPQGGLSAPEKEQRREHSDSPLQQNKKGVKKVQIPPQNKKKVHKKSHNALVTEHRGESHGPPLQQNFSRFFEHSQLLPVRSKTPPFPLLQSIREGKVFRPTRSARPMRAAATASFPHDPALYTQVPKQYHDYLDVFSEPACNVLPPHRKYDLEIPLLPGAKLPWGPLYSMSGVELEAMREYIKTNLANGFIRPSKSPAAAPVMFVKRPDGKLRLVVDYRALNSVTVKNRFPLPLIPEMLDRLHRAKVFTKLDLRNAFHQVRVKEGDEYKTAFRCREGHYEFCVAPMGACNTPACFQYFMNDILKAYLDLSCVGILDDVIVFSETEAEHVGHVRQILEVLRQHRLYAKIQKCEFHKEEMTFVGYMVSKAGIGMDPAKVSAILDWPVPRTVKEVQSFLGFANFYRKFIVNYSELATPLTTLTRKSIPFTWSPAAAASFRSLQLAFTQAPVLHHFQPDQPCTVEADASDFALGCVLSQPSSTGELHPICFYSRKLTAAELNYPIYDKELLAVVEAFRQWRIYLEGAGAVDTQGQSVGPGPTQVFTDHKNLEYFSTARTTSRRHARWAATLATFKYTICWRKGAANGKADALSRRPDHVPPPLPSLPILNPTASATPRPLPSLRAAAVLLSPSDPLLPAIAAAQAADFGISAIIQQLSGRPGGESNPPLPGGRPSGGSDMELRGGILYKQGKVCIPPSASALILTILQQYHDSPLAGHYGVTRTQALVGQYFEWRGMATAVEAYVRSCDACQRNKVVRHAPFGLLNPLPIPSQPWSSISLDWITDLPPSNYHDAILVVVDRLTKQALFIPTTKSLPASDVASLFLQHVVRVHGIPESIVSDRDPIFTSHFWGRLLDLMQMKANRSTAFHPQTDGQTERLNSVLEQYLRIHTDYQQTDWAGLLPMAEFSYNNSKHSATTMSPFFANYGYHPRMSLLPTSSDSLVPAADSYIDRLHTAHVTLQRELLKARNAMELSANRKRRPAPDLIPGQLVWLLRRNVATTRPSSKLDVRRLGPFPVIGPVGRSAFRLSLPPSMKIHPVFHVSLLEPHVANTFPGRVVPPPLPILVDGLEEFEVHLVVDSKIWRRKLYYLIEWVGYTNEHNTWVPVGDVQNAGQAIAAYHFKYPGRAGAPRV